VPLSKTRNYPQGLEAWVESRAKCKVKKSMVPVESMLSAVWLRSCGEEVAPVIGINGTAWRADEKQDGKGLVCDSGSRLIPLKEQGEAGWRQQTLLLYDSLTPKLLQFLRRLGLNKNEMDDVIQESFLRLAGHLKSGSSDDNLHSWVYRVARNLAMDVHRSNQRDQEEVELKPQDEPIDPEANPEGVYLQKEQFKRVKAAMSRLTARQYNSILLRAQGLRYREIGELLGISEQRAIHLVKRGLQRLIT
jgi:RNA polymerase sigma-70 factor, ECF subfamily